ncbi:MAG: LLM class flavin-dependent oxidoreductase [Acidimicrobiia bacterium]|nr:LLM class flavin-dependent oxidoreductase [Acidimicrobiia bacterium]
MRASPIRFAGVGLSLSNEEPAAVTLAQGVQADELGYDEVSIPESRLHRSTTSVAAAILAQTRSVTVRVGVANPVTRHPLLLALEAATLADIGPGRVRFGVGACEWTMRAFECEPEGWLPYSNTVEAVRAMRSLLAGGSVGFEPETFDSDADLRLDLASPAPVPVDVGAVNARMLTAAGRWADGVQLGALMSPAYVAWAAERIAEGARAEGRDPGEVLVSGNVLTSLDRDRAAARREVCEVLAYYLARVEGVVVDRSGADPEAVAAVRAAVRREGLAAGTATVSGQLIDTFAVTGDTDEVIERLMPFGAAGMAMPLLWYTLGPEPTWAVEALAAEVVPAVRPEPS